MAKNHLLTYYGALVDIEQLPMTQFTAKHGLGGQEYDA